MSVCRGAEPEHLAHDSEAPQSRGRPCDHDIAEKPFSGTTAGTGNGRAAVPMRLAQPAQTLALTPQRLI